MFKKCLDMPSFPNLFRHDLKLDSLVQWTGVKTFYWIWSK